MCVRARRLSGARGSESFARATHDAAMTLRSPLRDSLGLLSRRMVDQNSASWNRVEERLAHVLDLRAHTLATC
jgi:hypothetical protein